MVVLEYFQAFWDYLVLTAPYLIAGFLASGLIHEFLNMAFIQRHLSAPGIGSVLKASLFGVPLPLCSCSVIPAAVTLKKEGASNATTSAFLISTPESGVDSIAMTYGVMDLPMTIIRPIAAFLTATIAGLGQDLFNRHGGEFPAKDEEVSCCHKEAKLLSKESKVIKGKRILDFSFNDLSDDLSFWLFIGLAVGALLNMVLPTEIFTEIPGWAQKLAVLGFGIPFYICASASTPIAASLILKGMSPGTALIFLLVGPATNFTNISVLHRYIGKKGVFINVVVIGLVALGLSYVVDFLYANFAWSTAFKIGALHDHAPTWWEHGLAIFLALLLVKGIYKEKIKPYIKTGKTKSCCS